MARITITNLAQAAGVSVSTVNRVLAGRDGVREDTIERVLRAAQDIGYHAVDSIRHQFSQRPKPATLGFVLPANKTFYQNLASALQQALKDWASYDVAIRIEFLVDLSPEHVAEQLEKLGMQVDAVCVVAAQHPKVARAIEMLHEKGIPVYALISELSASRDVPYIGLDNWKVGRVAGWAMNNICRTTGEFGVIIGSHRYRCQELNESGFRSYLREHAPKLKVLESLSSFEHRDIAAEHTRTLLNNYPDLQGIYVAGGGVTGTLAALKECKREGTLTVIAHDLTTETRRGLLDSTLTLVISHPLHELARVALEMMIQSVHEPTVQQRLSVALPFDLYTSENH